MARAVIEVRNEEEGPCSWVPFFWPERDPGATKRLSSAHAGPRLATSAFSAFMTHPSDGAQIANLIDERTLRERVAELGAQIRADYGDEEITLLSILKGSFIFTADLARAITGPVAIEFLGVQSYGDHTKSTGVVKITHDLTKPIEGKHVLLVEDIVDTGLTMKYLVEVLSARKPASLKICSLLKRPSASPSVPVDYVGFPLGDGFVVGYGLDWAQRFRNLPYLGVVES